MVSTSPNLHPLGVETKRWLRRKTRLALTSLCQQSRRTAAQIRETQLPLLSAKLMVDRRQDCQRKQRAYQLLRLIKSCEGKHLRTSFLKASVCQEYPPNGCHIQ